MADDARTEARRRIAAAIHRGHCGCADAGPEHEDGDQSYLEQANAVLGLFPTVFWMPADGAAWREQFLMLRGPVEPVTGRPRS